MRNASAPAAARLHELDEGTGLSRAQDEVLAANADGSGHSPCTTPTWDDVEDLVADCLAAEPADATAPLPARKCPAPPPTPRLLPASTGLTEQASTAPGRSCGALGAPRPAPVPRCWRGRDGKARSAAAV